MRTFRDWKRKRGWITDPKVMMDKPRSPSWGSFYGMFRSPSIDEELTRSIIQWSELDQIEGMFQVDVWPILPLGNAGIVHEFAKDIRSRACGIISMVTAPHAVENRGIVFQPSMWFADEADAVAIKLAVDYVSTRPSKSPIPKDFRGISWQT